MGMFGDLASNLVGGITDIGGSVINAPGSVLSELGNFTGTNKKRKSKRPISDGSFVDQYANYVDIGSSLAADPTQNISKLDIPMVSKEDLVATGFLDSMDSSYTDQTKKNAQSSLDNMFNMFQKRKKQVQTSKMMPGQSQLVSLS